jgi:hypothetical protein
MRHVLIAIAILTTPLLADQTPAKRSPEQMRTSYDAHRGDFDYLLGDWEFTANSQQYGKFRGYWSAVRVGDGADVLDEYRVVGDNDETFYVTRTLRVYNAAADRWELVSTDTGSILVDGRSIDGRRKNVDAEVSGDRGASHRTGALARRADASEKTLTLTFDVSRSSTSSASQRPSDESFRRIAGSDRLLRDAG